MGWQDDPVIGAEPPQPGWMGDPIIGESSPTQGARAVAGNEYLLEGPSRLARIGRGASDITQGLAQRTLQAVGGLPQATPSIQELRAYASLEEQKLSDAELIARFQQQSPAANYTAKVNEELALYNRGREAQGGGFDTYRLAGNIAATAPLVAVGPAGATLGARAAAGAAQGGLAGASQFTESGSLADTAVNTGVGAGVGAVVAPAVGYLGDKIGHAAQKIVGWWRGARASANLDDLLKAVPELQELPQQAQRDLIAEAQAQIRTTGTLNAEQLARKANLVAQGVTPTKSMVTRNPADWTVERNLQKLAQSPDETLSQVGRDLTGVYETNDRALASRLASLREGLPAGTQEAHGMAVMRSLDDLADASQKDVGALYKVVRDTSGDQLASDARNLASTLDDLRDNTYAEKLVGSVSNKLRRFGMLDQEGNLTSKTLTVTQAEELRKFVNTLPNDFGKRDIIRAIDSDVIAGAGEDAFAGARGAAAQRFAMLENPATQRALGALGELNQGKTAQSFIKSQVIDAAEQDVKSLVSTLQKLPKDQAGQAMSELQAGVLQHLEDKAISANSGKFSGAALNRAMRDIGEGKLVRILGVGQYQQLRNLARASLDATFEPPYSAVNTSGTAPMLMSLMRGARTVPGVPILITDEAAKIAARRGYASQLRDVLAARATGELPPVPAPVQEITGTTTAASSPAVVVMLNAARKKSDENRRKRQ